MQREWEVLVTVKISIIKDASSFGRAEAEKIAAEKIRTAVSALHAQIVRTES